MIVTICHTWCNGVIQYFETFGLQLLLYIIFTSLESRIFKLWQHFSWEKSCGMLMGNASRIPLGTLCVP